MKTPVYLDHHATTPLDPRVRDVLERVQRDLEEDGPAVRLAGKMRTLDAQVAQVVLDRVDDVLILCLARPGPLALGLRLPLCWEASPGPMRTPAPVLALTLAGRSLPDVMALPVAEAGKFFRRLRLKGTAGAVAREVLAANRLEAPVCVSLGSIDEAGQRDWHGVVANIELSFFLAESTRLAGLLRPGGTLIASGFLGRDVGDVRIALERANLKTVDTVQDGPWAAIVARLEVS